MNEHVKRATEVMRSIAERLSPTSRALFPLAIGSLGFRFAAPQALCFRAPRALHTWSFSKLLDHRNLHTFFARGICRLLISRIHVPGDAEAGIVGEYAVQTFSGFVGAVGD